MKELMLCYLYVFIEIYIPWLWKKITDIFASIYPRRMLLINPLRENWTVQTFNVRKACKALIYIYMYVCIYIYIYMYIYMYINVHRYLFVYISWILYIDSFRYTNALDYQTKISVTISMTTCKGNGWNKGYAQK